MFISLLIFFILLTILFFLSNKITKNLYLFFFLLTGNKNAALNLLSFFLLPGTVIHEFSHLIIAELLFVRTGEFSFKPEIEEEEVKVGRLKITKTDPIRRTIIGLAPLIIGLTIIGITCHFYLFPQLNKIQQFFPRSWIEKIYDPGSKLPATPLPQFLITFAICYLIFNISITMFSSKKDLETAIFPLTLLALVVIFLWLAGFKLSFPQYFLEVLNSLFATLNKALLFVCLLDSAGFLGIKVFIWLAGKILRKSLKA